MKTRRKKADPVDSLIEKTWYQRASGVPVNIMDIPTIFKECRAAVNALSPVVPSPEQLQETLNNAVDACIAKFRRS